MGIRPLVAIVDDDESVRDSLPDLLRQMGVDAEAFPSAAVFLDSPVLQSANCLLLDVSMPDMSGPDVQQELRRRRPALPIVFITANADEALRQRLRAAGAVECLFKPLQEAALLAALNAALRARLG